MKNTPIAYLRALFKGWLGTISTLLTGIAILVYLLNPYLSAWTQTIPDRILILVGVLSFLIANFNFYKRSQSPGESLPNTFKYLDETEAAEAKASEIKNLSPPGKPKTEFSIQGTWWMRDWTHENEIKRKIKTLSKNAKLSQSGQRIEGSFSNSEGTYELVGKIKNSFFFMGDWWEVITDEQPRPVWYGSFMFRIYYDREETTMLGRWVGVTSDQESVKCGVWEWCKPEKTFPTDKLQRSQSGPN